MYRHTGGIPRRINTLCSRVLLYGALEEAARITARDGRGDRRRVEPRSGGGRRARRRSVNGGPGRRTDAARDRSAESGAARHGAIAARMHASRRSEARRGPAATACCSRLVDAAQRQRDADAVNACRSVNAMTVDVEDYFQVQAFADCIARATGTASPRRVEANVDRILEQFDAAGVHGTFFTLGWIAERHPAMVRRIVAAGHELASHGWDHTRADTQDPAAFRADVRPHPPDAGGHRRRAGARLPRATFSHRRAQPWAFGVLREAGYRYSSSINPIRHDLYGMPDAPRTPYQPDGGALWEIPMTTVAAFGRNWPCSGGGFSACCRISFTAAAWPL